MSRPKISLSYNFEGYGNLTFSTNDVEEDNLGMSLGVDMGLTSNERYSLIEWSKDEYQRILKGEFTNFCT
jgi:hypothetical protein